MKAYARFQSAPIGAGLLATDGGLILSTTLSPASIARTARSDVGVSLGISGAEFVFWGEGTLIAAIGLVQPSASLAAAVGAVAGTCGWRLDEGKVYLDGVERTSGLTVPTKQQIVGVRYRQQSGGVYVAEYYLEQTLLFVQSLPAGATWHFAVSLAAESPGDLLCAVNAGQWPALSACGHAGWLVPQPPMLTIQMADAYYLSGPLDSPANSRWDGALVGAIETYAEVGFWPWDTNVSPRGGAAQVSVATDRVDLSGVLDGASVRVREVQQRSTLATAIDRGRYVVDSVEPERDGRSRLRLRDPHDDLDLPVNPGVFLPATPALAWRQQPFVVGAMCSVPFLPVNSDATVGFLADSPLASIDAVMDRGDLMEPGTWSLERGQQLFMEAPPQQPVLADVSTIGVSMAPASLLQALLSIFSVQGFRSWTTADAAAIDTACGYVGIGYYVSTSTSVRQARDQVLSNYTAAAYAGPDGVLRFVRLVDPDTLPISAELDASILIGDLIPRLDTAPNLTRRMYYRPNAQQMDAADFVTDLVDVPADRRQTLMAPGRGLVYYSGPLARAYEAAERRAPFVSGFYHEGDAQTELNRVCGLYTTERHFWSWTARGDRAMAALSSLQPGQAVNVMYPRHGLSAGRRLLVAAVRRSLGDGRVVLKLWG